MSAWQRSLEDMRREAFHKTRTRSARELEVAGAARAGGGTLEEMTLRFDKLMAQAGLGRPSFAERVIRGWLFLLDRHIENGEVFWHLSVRKVDGNVGPADAVFVDTCVELLGAPPDPLFVPPHPAQPIHWRWRDQTDQDDDLEVIDDVTSAPRASA